MREIDKTAMSYWFPKIEAAGLPVPRTTMVPMPTDAQRDLFRSFDQEQMHGEYAAFVKTLEPIAESLGYPCFVRTEFTSAKHDWELACYVKAYAELADHISHIVYFSECCAPGGELGYNFWAIREFLPTMPIGVCRGYSNMPICREFRFFVEDDKVVCWHPYWPRHALDDGNPVYSGPPMSYEEFCTPPDLAALEKIASDAGRAVGGAWSVDLLETKRGWFLTDMAEAHRSFHWEGCQVHGKQR